MRSQGLVLRMLDLRNQELQVLITVQVLSLHLLLRTARSKPMHNIGLETSSILVHLLIIRRLAHFSLLLEHAASSHLLE